MSSFINHDFLKELLTKHTNLVQEFEPDYDLEFFSIPECFTLRGANIQDFDFRNYKLSGAHFINCSFSNCRFDNRDIFELSMFCCLFTDCQIELTCSSASLFGNTHRQGSLYLKGAAEINHLTGIESEIILDVKHSTLCNLDIDEGSFDLTMTQSKLFDLKHKNLSIFHVDLDEESVFI